VPRVGDLPGRPRRLRRLGSPARPPARPSRPAGASSMDELTHDDAGIDAAGDADLTGPTTDLTPRAVPAARRRRRRTPWAAIALVLVVAALLVVVFNGLGDATLFFRNADEAVAQRDSLGDRRFRI